MQISLVPIFDWYVTSDHNYILVSKINNSYVGPKLIVEILEIWSNVQILGTNQELWPNVDLCSYLLKTRIQCLLFKSYFRYQAEY